MVFSKHTIFSLLTGSLLLCFFLLDPTAAVPPSSDSVCDSFAVHAGTAITFAASNKVTGGDVGVSARLATSVSAAWAAAVEIQNVYTGFAAEMGGQTFTPGTWRAGTINIAAGTSVILDGENDPDSVFLFQSESTMLAGADSEIVLYNGTKAENVLWALGTTFSSGVNTEIQGSILAGTAITFGARNNINGCAVALSAITFATDNYVTMP
jgi:type IV secretory pathway TrbD component